MPANNKALAIKAIVVSQVTSKASLMNVVMLSGYLIFRMLLLQGGQFIFAWKFFINLCNRCYLSFFCSLPRRIKLLVHEKGPKWLSSFLENEADDRHVIRRG
jgi:hypothetical protein